MEYRITSTYLTYDNVTIMRQANNSWVNVKPTEATAAAIKRM